MLLFELIIVSLLITPIEAVDSINAGSCVNTAIYETQQPVEAEYTIPDHVISELRAAWHQYQANQAILSSV